MFCANTGTSMEDNYYLISDLYVAARSRFVLGKRRRKEKGHRCNLSSPPREKSLEVHHLKILGPDFLLRIVEDVRPGPYQGDPEGGYCGDRRRGRPKAISENSTNCQGGKWDSGELNQKTRDSPWS